MALLNSSNNKNYHYTEHIDIKYLLQTSFSLYLHN